MVIETPDYAAAADVAEKVEAVAASIKEHRSKLESGFTQLGRLALKIRDERHWITLGYKRFRDYLEDLDKKYSISPAKTYNCIDLAENLLPSVPEQDLLDMGITKANELKQIVTAGQQIPEEILATAKDKSNTAEDLRSAVAEFLHRDEPDKGVWFQFSGFFCSAEERAEIQKAFDTALSIEPAVPNTVPEVVRRKEIVLRLVAEFMSTWGGSGG